MSEKELFCAICSEIAGHDVAHELPQCSKSPSRKGNISYDLKAYHKLLDVKYGMHVKTVRIDTGEWEIVEKNEAEGTISQDPTTCAHGVDLRGNRIAFLDQVNFCRECELAGDYKQ